MMRSDQLARQVAALATGGASSRPTLIAVDGPDASGKTTLADEIARACPSQGRPVVRIQADHFLQSPTLRYRQGRDSPVGFFEDTYDLDALVQRVLVPLIEGDQRIVRRHYDRERDGPFGDPLERVPSNALVIVDGLFLLRRELRRFWDLSIFLEVTENERLRRALNRDATRLGSSHGVVLRYRTRYLPGFALYVHREDPQAIADIIIGNERLGDPQVLRWPGRRPD
jgi:uridine kinase